MKKLNAPASLLLIALCAFLTDCASAPPDVFVFEHLEQRLLTDPITGHLFLKASPVCLKEINEPECGHGVSIVSGKTIFVGEEKEVQFNGKPWSQIRRESIMMPAEESYAPLAAWIINSCAKEKCSAAVDRFKVKLDFLEKIKSP